jgi:hypothetical protein
MSALNPKECLQPTDFEMLLDPATPSEVSAPLRAHIAECEQCETEFTLFQRFLEEEPGEQELADVEWIEKRLGPAKEKPHRQNWFQKLWASGPAPKWAVSLAMLLIVVAGGLELRRMQQGQLPGEEGTSGVVRSASVELVGPAGDIVEKPNTFEWKPVPGATAYVLKVMEVDGTVVAEQKAESNSAPADSKLGELFLPGKTLQWQVTAVDATGKQLAESPVEKFRVVR